MGIFVTAANAVSCVSVFAILQILYWTPKITHQFSNEVNLVLTLNFCVLKVTGAMAFNLCCHFIIFIIYKGPDFRLQN